MKKILNTKVKDMNAITLIALVVTIVILLIISTVTITLLVNNNLMKNTKTAVDKYNNSVDKEKYELAKIGNETDNLSSTRADVQASGNPMGTIIAYYNSTSPEGYLACDGAEYNLNEHPEYRQLAKFLGAADDATTFNVPDLRGEFLRGTGTNSHTNQGDGETVRVHQDGTFRFKGGENISSGSVTFGVYIDSINGIGGNYDKSFTGTGRYANYSASGTGNYTSTYGTYRPTNTSVLYCIKY